MYRETRALWVIITLCIGTALMVSAQWPPGGLISIQGTVAQFKPASEGNIDSLFLTDGTEVHFPPSYYSQISAIAKPGEQIQVTGWTYVGPLGDKHVYATVISGNDSSVSVAYYQQQTVATGQQVAPLVTNMQPTTLSNPAPGTSAPAAAPSIYPALLASTSTPSTGYAYGPPSPPTPGVPIAPPPPGAGPLGAPPQPAPPPPPGAGPVGPLGTLPQPAPTGGYAPSPVPLYPSPTSDTPSAQGYTATPTWTTVSGTVQSYRYGPSGEIEGLILDSGVEVHLQPLLAYWIPSVAPIGSQVQVSGWLSATPYGEKLLEASLIFNPATGAKVGSEPYQQPAGQNNTPSQP